MYIRHLAVGTRFAFYLVMKTQKIEFTNCEQAKRQVALFHALGLWARYLGAANGFYYVSVEVMA